MKYYVEWEDKEYNEIFNTITDEKGLAYLKKFPEIREVYIIKEVEDCE